MVEVERGPAQDGLQQIIGKDIDVHSRLVFRNAYTLLMKMKNAEKES